MNGDNTRPDVRRLKPNIWASGEHSDGSIVPSLVKCAKWMGIVYATLCCLVMGTSVVCVTAQRLIDLLAHQKAVQSAAKSEYTASVSMLANDLVVRNLKLLKPSLQIAGADDIEVQQFDEDGRLIRFEVKGLAKCRDVRAVYTVNVNLARDQSSPSKPVIEGFSVRICFPEPAPKA